MRKIACGIALALWAFLTPLAHAQESNYPARKPIILNTSPHVELSGFSFGNWFVDRRMRFEQHLSWTNTASQPLIAFEIVVLKYDAFDQRLLGSRWIVTGKNSADWRPLEPKEESHDGTIGFGSEEVLTAIAYVRSARLADGTVWRVNDVELMNQLRKLAPGIRDFGSVKPDPKQKND
jgi:hypothetical protein